MIRDSRRRSSLRLLAPLLLSWRKVLLQVSCDRWRLQGRRWRWQYLPRQRMEERERSGARCWGWRHRRDCARWQRDHSWPRPPGRSSRLGVRRMMLNWTEGREVSSWVQWSSTSPLVGGDIAGADRDYRECGASTDWATMVVNASDEGRDATQQTGLRERSRRPVCIGENPRTGIEPRAAERAASVDPAGRRGG